MFLFRQLYRMKTPEGQKRLLAVLVEETTLVGAKGAAIEAIQATTRGRTVELVGQIEHIPLPYHLNVVDDAE